MRCSRGGGGRTSGYRERLVVKNRRKNQQPLSLRSNSGPPPPPPSAPLPSAPLPSRPSPPLLPRSRPRLFPLLARNGQERLSETADLSFGAVRHDGDQLERRSTQRRRKVQVATNGFSEDALEIVGVEMGGGMVADKRI